MTAARTGVPITCVSVSSALGGSERVLLEFAARAPALGLSPTVVLPKPGPLAEALAAERVPTVLAPAPDRLLAASQRAGSLAGQLPAFVVDLLAWSRRIAQALPPGTRLLFSNGFKAHVACAAIPGLRRVWHLHEFPPPRVGPMWRVLAAAAPTATIAVSAAVGRAWRVPGFTAPRVVLNGVDLARFAPVQRTYRIHEQLALPHHTRLIGMPAVFARWKGQMLVVEAFERLAASCPDAHLVIVGGPIYDTSSERGYAEEMVRRVKRSSLPSLDSARSLSDRIHFVRFDPEPWHLYPEFDVTVHYSTRPEPFGRVLLESMACGIPVIGAKAGGPLEIVEDGQTGWLVPPRDVGALAEVIERALRSDLGPMGRAARLRAEAQFSADRSAREVADVLLRALATGGRTRA